MLENNTLFAGSVDRKVYAIDLADGQILWSARLPGMIVGGVLVAGDTVFAASSRPQGRIVALRRGNGKQIWRSSTPAIGAPLALIENVLVAPTQRGEILALDPATGRILWRRRLGVTRTAAVPAGAGGLVVATTDSLFRLSTRDGRVTHRAASPGTILSGWLQQRGALVAGTTDSQVVSIRPGDLRQNWSVEVDAPVLGAPAARGDTIYFVSRTGTLYRIDRHSEPVVKTLAALDWAVTSPVAIAGRQIFLGGADGVIRALRLDGSEMWRVRVWRPVELGPVAVSGGIVALGGNGDLHRFQL
jgi:outer membrane protein assembly factor BamB